jgi:hypothetical protein
MAMFLKVMHDHDNQGVLEDLAAYSMYAEITSCHFNRYGGIDRPIGVFGEAHVWVREPVKTAEVSGFCEVDKRIQLGGSAYLMNEQGRTISKFVPDYDAGCSQGGDTVDDDFLTRITYDTAAEIRRCALFAAKNGAEGISAGAQKVVSLMDRLRVAMDVK